MAAKATKDEKHVDAWRQLYIFELANQMEAIEMNEWISVDDAEKPITQDYQSAYLTRDVIVTNGYRVWVSSYAIGGNHVGIPWEGFTEDSITHWMPLPDTPVA